MVYAPIIIPTLCRDKHFIKCVESLKKNSYAIYTDVYIALDFPAKEEHKSGYEKISKYLEGDFSEFRNFYVIKREKNLGPDKNMKEMYDVILQKYDRFIRSDDDVEFSPNFLEYMDKCLEYFQDDENILCVTGYSYPIKWEVSPGSTVLKENFICPMWGTGFWTKKYLKVREDIKNNELYKDFSTYLCGNYMKKAPISKMTDAAICDYLNGGLVLNIEESIMHSTTDVALRVYLILKNKYTIMPVESKVRNCGFDGTGTYCQDISKKFDQKYADTYNYSLQKIDTNNTFTVLLNKQNSIDINKQKLNKFDKRKKITLLFCRAKVFLYKSLGEKRYKKVIEFVRRKRGR